MNEPTLINRILLTGAAGALGKVLRTGLRPCAKRIRLSDIAPIDGPTHDNEEIVHCDLTDKELVNHMVQGADAVVHTGGLSTEHAFEEIQQTNITGLFHLYEAARQHHVKRVIFASSNHVIGFYSQSQVIDTFIPHRPDSYYGLSKSFGENLAQFYFDRHGIETVSVRIGSCFPEPLDVRMLSTWLSYDDLVALVRCALVAPGVGHTVVYGVSDNPNSFWDNAVAARIGFRAKDSSEPFRERLLANRLPTSDALVTYHGGNFVTTGPFDTPVPFRSEARRPPESFDAS